MFETHDEQLINKHEVKVKELTTKFENLENRFDQLFSEYQISKEELTSFLEDPVNFDHQTWNEMQKVKTHLDQKLSQELDSLKNPHTTRNKYRELRYAQNWIPVR